MFFLELIRCLVLGFDNILYALSLHTIARIYTSIHISFLFSPVL